MKIKDIDLLIGRNLKRIRKSKELSQEQLGKLINNPPTKISALENGKEGLGKELMSKLCTELKIRPAEFYVEPEMPTIINEKEQLHISKFREAEQLQVDDEISLFTQWTIEQARSKKNKSHTNKSERKSTKIQKEKMRSVQ